MTIFTSKFKSAGLMIRVKILNNYLGPYPPDLSLHVFNLNFYYENHFYSFLVKHKCKASTIRLRAAQAGNHFPVWWLIFGSSTYTIRWLKRLLGAKSLSLGGGKVKRKLRKSVFMEEYISRSFEVTENNKRTEIGLIWVLIESSWISRQNETLGISF